VYDIRIEPQDDLTVEEVKKKIIDAFDNRLWGVHSTYEYVEILNID
jgi:hypothetical protein